MPGPGFADEDDVDVAGVVELAGAALAHGDDGEPDVRGVVGQRGLGLAQRGFEGGAGQVGKLFGDLLEPQFAGEVTRGDRQQPAAVRQAQAVGIGGTAEGGQVVLVPGRSAQDPPLPHVPGEMVAERSACPEHGEQRG